MTNESTRRRFLATAGIAATTTLAGCSGLTGGGDDGGDAYGDSTTTEASTSTTEDGMSGGMDPSEAPRASIDRFSEDAGTLMVRTDENGLPGPDEPIDFDQKPFIQHGLGPDGDVVSYYNFDVQPVDPAPIFALFREGEDTPVAGQLNVIDTIPGDEGYNDFWQVFKVTVPADYEANTVTKAQDIRDADYDVEATNIVKNCPVVPDGSSASARVGDGDAGLVEGWYDDHVVSYFLFEESKLTLADGEVPTSPIYVTFNTNPGQEGGGPPSGFVTEDGNQQTHNVVATLPSDDAYSPLWMVNIYDNADFDSVSDLDSATNANILKTGAANVNCPLVSVGEQA